jgi:hypothetical protein
MFQAMELVFNCPLDKAAGCLPSAIFSHQERADSKSTDQIPNFHFQGFGNPQEGVKADPLFAAFDFADVNRMQIRPLGELFLAQSSPLAAFADRFTQNFEMFWFARHGYSGKQEDRGGNTPNMGLFLKLAFA